MKMGEYFYTGMMFLSIVLIYFAYQNFNKTQRLVNTGVKTKGMVTDLIEVRGDDGYTYKPVFEYIDKNHESQNTICAGGRYDSLFENLCDKNIPALGFAIGIERL